MIATRIREESPICQPLAGMVRDIAISHNPKYVKDQYMAKVMDNFPATFFHHRWGIQSGTNERFFEGVGGISPGFTLFVLEHMTV